MKLNIVTNQYVDKRVSDIKTHYAYFTNQLNGFVHVVIPYDRMIYDKGSMFIYATFNGIPYVGMICYRKGTATLHNLHVGDNGVKITLNEAKPEENRLLRMIIRIPEHSVLKLDCTDYFEYALTGA